MKSSLKFLAALGVFALVTTSTWQAAQRATRTPVHAVHAVRAVHEVNVATGSPCGASEKNCTGHCPLRSASRNTSAVMRGKAGTMKPANAGGVCPVSDPSKCPSSCSRDGASNAVASAVR